jgi:UDP-N-acetylglucosamine/UDP-N-acetylgalactosamine diphosphorylase
MISSTNSEWQKIIDRVYAHNQEQVFRFWDELNDTRKARLIEQLKKVDFDLLETLYEKSKEKEHAQTADLQTAEIISLAERKKRDTEVLAFGEDALKNGHVAAFLVAGGQGSRLGFDGPKGIYPVTPVKHKSLFQNQAEKLQALAGKYGCVIPWYIMTSRTNHRQTIDYFKKENYFGYPADKIKFFMQDMLAALDYSGKLILDEKDHIFESPNGHGGSIKALWDSGAVEEMEKNGVKYIFYFQVDNVLVNICDPYYLGYHIEGQAQISNKVVRKVNAEEKMGVICRINGKTGVMEYSDLDEKDMYAIDEKGELKYWGGNTAVHIFSVDFIRMENERGFRLPYHIAHKSISYLNENGEIIKPQDKNGLKFETFVFDAMADADNITTIEIKREEEFSALKNKEGADSPVTVLRDQLKLFASWLKEAGIDVPFDNNGIPAVKIEISPLFALNAQELADKKDEIPVIKGDLYLG